MNESTKPREVHPAGEEEFTFATAGGRVRLSVTEDALTPFGGLVPWAAYSKHIGIAEQLAADCPVRRTSPNAAPVYDIIQSFMLTALTDGRRFSHVERLREDPTIPELFGLESVVGFRHGAALLQIRRSGARRGVDRPQYQAPVGRLA